MGLLRVVVAHTRMALPGAVGGQLETLDPASDPCQSARTGHACDGQARAGPPWRHGERGLDTRSRGSAPRHSHARVARAAARESREVLGARRTEDGDPGDLPRLLCLGAERRREDSERGPVTNRRRCISGSLDRLRRSGSSQSSRRTWPRPSREPGRALGQADSSPDVRDASNVSSGESPATASRNVRTRG
jgi:hypothetical protein